MTTIQKKICIALGLVLSTLIFPMSIIYCFIIFPALYTGFIVPFFLWRNVFDGKFEYISKSSVLWKIPAILLLYIMLNEGELWILYIVPLLPEDLTLRMVVVIFIILILRIIIYAEMLLLWQPSLFKKFPRIQLFIICLTIITTIVAGCSIVSNIDIYKDMYILYTLSF